jgi:ABC-type Na+ efflux pump permease subunit
VKTAAEDVKTAEEGVKTAEEGEGDEAAAEDDKVEEVKKDKVSTTISVPADQKSTIKPKARSAIVSYAKSKGYSRVTNIETSERCSGKTCTVTVTGLAAK